MRVCGQLDGLVGVMRFSRRSFRGLVGARFLREQHQLAVKRMVQRHMLTHSFLREDVDSNALKKVVFGDMAAWN